MLRPFSKASLNAAGLIQVIQQACLPLFLLIFSCLQVHASDEHQRAIEELTALGTKVLKDERGRVMVGFPFAAPQS